MAEHFDLIVLGTGAGGAAVAMKCREAGWTVAIADARPFGGTCALRGCDPKKVLVGAAEVLDRARGLARKGIAGEPRIDWRELIRFKRTFTEPVPQSRERDFASAGITTLHGAARFVDRRTLVVDGRQLEAKHVHIATGAKPAELPIRGVEHLTTSEQLLDLDELPRRIVFLGSGYIAFEFAHVAASAGAKVAMFEQRENPLAGFDPDLVSLLVERTRSMGIEIHLDTRVEAVERRGSALVVRAVSGAGPIAHEADIVVHGAGRVPDIGDLGLEAAGVEHDERGIIVNEYMQSVSNPAVYAAGDMARGGLPLTPVAGREAEVAASNLLAGNHRKIEYPETPTVVFTLPPLAAVGLQEGEAKQRGLKFRINHARTSDWYSSRRVGEEASGYKVLVEEGSERILGAHLLGLHSDELINLFALAMHCGLTSRQIKSALFAYPTRGSDVRYMV